VAIRTITLGPSDGQHVAVKKGLEPGERVVVDGADRLKPGVKVAIVRAGGAAGPAKPPPRRKPRG
jgi:membrane fusion protein, multidrug efflux system